MPAPSYSMEVIRENKIVNGRANSAIYYKPALFTLLPVYRHVQRLFQSEFSTECDVVLSRSISSILSFP